MDLKRTKLLKHRQYLPSRNEYLFLFGSKPNSSLIWLVCVFTRISLVQAQCPWGMNPDGYCGIGKFICINPSNRCYGTTCCEYTDRNIPTSYPFGGGFGALGYPETYRPAIPAVYPAVSIPSYQTISSYPSLPSYTGSTGIIGVPSVNGLGRSSLSNGMLCRDVSQLCIQYISMCNIGRIAQSCGASCGVCGGNGLTGLASGGLGTAGIRSTADPLGNINPLLAGLGDGTVGTGPINGLSTLGGIGTGGIGLGTAGLGLGTTGLGLGTTGIGLGTSGINLGTSGLGSTGISLGTGLGTTSINLGTSGSTGLGYGALNLNGLGGSSGLSGLAVG